MNDLIHKRENVMRDVEYGSVRIEVDNEIIGFPGNWTWAIDASQVRVYQPDGSIIVYPIHRVWSVEDDRAADHSDEKAEADAEIDEQERAEARRVAASEEPQPTKPGFGSELAADYSHAADDD